MTEMSTKTCSVCGARFGCDIDDPNAECWCAELPAIVPLGADDCRCPECLKSLVKDKIAQYVATITPENAATNIAKDLPANKKLIEDIDYYINEEGNFVFTAWHHLRRGYCCENGCKHCPYGFKKQ